MESSSSAMLRERKSSRRRKHDNGRRRRDVDGFPLGCIRAVFNLFEFPHSSHHCQHSSKPGTENDDVPKGCEAPRNSVEVSMKIRTRVREDVDSPAATTPSLVARLMGLDSIPDSPRLELRGTRSLPETPRVSSAETRLSLQIIKENMNPNDRLFMSLVSTAMKNKRLSNSDIDSKTTRANDSNHAISEKPLGSLKSKLPDIIASSKTSKPRAEKPKTINRKHQETFVKSKKPPHILSPSPTHVGRGHSAINNDVKRVVVRKEAPPSEAPIDEERDYFNRVLDHAKATVDSKRLTYRKLLNPSIFYYMEKFTDVGSSYRGRLRKPWNRRLLFELVDEILVRFGGIILPNMTELLCVQAAKSCRDSHDTVDSGRFPVAEIVMLLVELILDGMLRELIVM